MTRATRRSRDAPPRIHAAAQQAGLQRIDSHRHQPLPRGPRGGLEALSKLIQLGRFTARRQDRADDQKCTTFTTAPLPAHARQAATECAQGPGGGGRLGYSARPAGERGRTERTLANAEQKASAVWENQAGSALLTYGRFTFLDLIDMDWATELELVCPVNKVGAVSLFQSNRHGSWDGAGAPAFLGAIRPQVVVFNNGPRKGLGQLDANAKTTTPPGVTPPA